MEGAAHSNSHSISMHTYGPQLLLARKKKKKKKKEKEGAIMTLNHKRNM